MLSLELTDNSKTGPAFSLMRSLSCINRTPACTAACYGNSVRYQSSGQRTKRERNYKTCQYLIKEGGPELLAENLVILIDRARPSEYLIGIDFQPARPWTLRLHDVGDFFSISYVQAWRLAAKKRPLCNLWFYTRSFLDEQMLSELTGLASLENVRGWLSVDTDNFGAGIKAYACAPTVWNLAILQEEPETMANMLPALSLLEGAVSFPRHRSGRHVEPMYLDGVTVCPKVIGELTMDRQSRLAPCQVCQFCLPIR